MTAIPEILFSAQRSALHHTVPDDPRKPSNWTNGLKEMEDVINNVAYIMVTCGSDLYHLAACA